MIHLYSPSLPLQVDRYEFADLKQHINRSEKRTRCNSLDGFSFEAFTFDEGRLARRGPASSYNDSSARGKISIGFIPYQQSLSLLCMVGTRLSLD